VPNPRYYDSHRAAPGLMRKTDLILSRMYQMEIP